MTDAQVIHVLGVGYIVQSKSVPGAWRLVQGRECSCPAGGRKSCRHRRLVQEHCRALDAQFERPVGRVNPSMFVD